MNEKGKKGVNKERDWLGWNEIINEEEWIQQNRNEGIAQIRTKIFETMHERMKEEREKVW